MPTGHAEYDIWRRQPDGSLAPVKDVASVEEPLAIAVGGRGISVTMRTPGHDDELAVGFLLGEGVIAAPGDLVRVRRCTQNDGDLIDVLVAPHVAFDLARLTRHVFASSSCGLCGVAAVEAIRKQFPEVPDGLRVSGETLLSLPAALRQAQPTFDRTGGLHAAALFDPAGRFLAVREDVGRHNAVDKVIGRALMDGLVPLRGHGLLVSGRASFEIVQKALAAQISMLVAVSAPSSLAIDLAIESGITLVGFLRPTGFNVYSHPQRIVPSVK